MGNNNLKLYEKLNIQYVTQITFISELKTRLNRSRPHPLKALFRKVEMKTFV